MNSERTHPLYRMLLDRLERRSQTIFSLQQKLAKSGSEVHRLRTEGSPQQEQREGPVREWPPHEVVENPELVGSVTLECFNEVVAICNRLRKEAEEAKEACDLARSSNELSQRKADGLRKDLSRSMERRQELEEACALSQREADALRSSRDQAMTDLEGQRALRTVLEDRMDDARRILEVIVRDGDGCEEIETAIARLQLMPRNETEIQAAIARNQRETT